MFKLSNAGYTRDLGTLLDARALDPALTAALLDPANLLRSGRPNPRSLAIATGRTLDQVEAGLQSLREALS